MYFRRGWALSSYHEMRDLGLEDVHSLQLVEPSLSSANTKRRRLLHKTELGIEILFLLCIRESVPASDRQSTN